MDDLISVCVPIYNGEKYLEECLLSILSQSYKNIEVLVVDDGSKDNSLKLVKQLQEKDNRIRLVINGTNLGLVGNWQKCIALAKGKWVKFLFQDDVMQPDCVEKMLTACLENKVPVSVCSREFIIEPSAPFFLTNYIINYLFKLETKFTSPSKINASDFAELAVNRLFLNFIGEPIVLFFHKDIIKKVGNYNKDLVQLVDYEFALRVCLNYEIFFIPEDLVKFRVHSSSASSNQSNSEEKMVKNRFVEPLVMYHEYCFNPNFKLLREKAGKLNLIKQAISFYYYNSSKYLLSVEQEQELFAKYQGLKLFKRLSFSVPLKTKIKNLLPLI